MSDKLLTMACVIYHSTIETVDHMFLQYTFTASTWSLFDRLVQLAAIPILLIEVWCSRRTSVMPQVWEIGDLLTWAITWNIWLKRKEGIFNAKSLPLSSIIMKIDHMLFIVAFCSPEGEKSEVREFHCDYTNESSVHEIPYWNNWSEWRWRGGFHPEHRLAFSPYRGLEGHRGYVLLDDSPLVDQLYLSFSFVIVLLSLVML